MFQPIGMYRGSLFLFILQGLISVSQSAAPRRNWSSLDMKELERQWNPDEYGQDSLESDEIYQEGERRRLEAMEKLERLMANENSAKKGPGTDEFERLASEAQNAGKPAMIFAKLHPWKAVPRSKLEQALQSSARRVSMQVDSWNWESLAAICDEWQDRLFYAVIEVSCFPMDEQDSILITVKRGWDGEKVYEFLENHQYHFIEELKWDEKIRHFSVDKK